MAARDALPRQALTQAVLADDSRQRLGAEGHSTVEKGTRGGEGVGRCPDSRLEAVSLRHRGAGPIS